MNVKQRRNGTICAIVALFIALAYSYKNAVWVNEQYAMYFKRGDTSTPKSSPNLCVNCFRHNMQEAA